MRANGPNSYRHGMTTSTRSSVTTPALSRLRADGLVGAIASAVGAALAVVIIFWPPMVAEDRFSYPFDAAWFVLAQVIFAVQHAAMLPLFLGVLLLERHRPSRLLRVGTWLALAGQVALTVLELVATAARNGAMDSGIGATVNALYGLPMLLLGVGLITGGIGAMRVHLFDGAGRWLLLALGVYVFIVLFPAVFGPMVAGRIAIGVWLLLFCGLGLLLMRENQP